MKRNEFMTSVRIGTRVVVRGHIGNKLVYEVYDVDYLHGTCRIRSIGRWYEKRRCYRKVTMNQISLAEEPAC